jgi:hypothetical protein
MCKINIIIYLATSYAICLSMCVAVQDLIAGYITEQVRFVTPLKEVSQSG